MTEAEAPGGGYVCGGCGNKTRFDVTLRRRTKEFHHYSLAGELQVEEAEVLEEEIEEIACRWCGHGKAVSPASP